VDDAHSVEECAMLGPATGVQYAEYWSHVCVWLRGVDTDALLNSICGASIRKVARPACMCQSTRRGDESE